MGKEEQRKNYQDLVNLTIEAETMNTSYKLHIAHLMQLLYEGSILLLYVLGLVMTVALGASGLEMLFRNI